MWLVQPSHWTYRREGGQLPRGLEHEPDESIGLYHPYVYPVNEVLAIALKYVAGIYQVCICNVMY